MELLIVVLIIGILSAIALPQYQRSVLKSRFAALKPITEAIKVAQEAYYMEHGEYAEEMQDLQIQSNQTGEQDTHIVFSEEEGHDYVQATSGILTNRYTRYLDHSENFAGNIYCEAPSADEKAKGVCLAEGGTDPQEHKGYLLYLLAGNSTGKFEKPYELTSSTGSGPARVETYSNGEETITASHFYPGFSVTVNGTHYYKNGTPNWDTMCEEYPFLSFCD